MTLQTALILLFSGNALISLAAYLPQIYRLCIANTRAESISLSSWLMWFYTSVVGLLYGIFILKDALFIMVESVGLACVTTVLTLVVYNRYYRFPAKLKGKTA